MSPIFSLDFSIAPTTTHRGPELAGAACSARGARRKRPHTLRHRRQQPGEVERANGPCSRQNLVYQRKPCSPTVDPFPNFCSHPREAVPLSDVGTRAKLSKLITHLSVPMMLHTGAKPDALYGVLATFPSRAHRLIAIRALTILFVYLAVRKVFQYEGLSFAPYGYRVVALRNPRSVPCSRH